MGRRLCLVSGAPGGLFPAGAAADPGGLGGAAVGFPAVAGPGDVAAGNLPTRSFDLPYELKKAEFNQVLELYEASVGKDEYPNHGYRTDDGHIVRRAYCYGIIHSR